MTADELHDDVRTGLAELLASLRPGIGERLDSDPQAHLDLVATADAVAVEADRVRQSAIDAARAAGLSWEKIGTCLGITRQAAQQRFGAPAPAAPVSGTWRLTPVTSLDEMDKLGMLGEHGWHSVGFGSLYHDLQHDDVQWEHRRVLAWQAPGAKAEGWSRVGSMWFPWAYYTRPTTRPALPGLPSMLVFGPR